MKPRVIINNHLADHSFTSTQQIIQQYPKGTFTTCRTWKGHSIVDLHAHLQRLEAAHSSIKTDKKPDIKSIVMPSIQYALYKPEHNGNQEKRLTIVYGPKKDHEDLFDLIIWEELLPEPRKPPIIVEIHKGVRDNPELKTTAWAIDRKKFEQLKRPEIEEIILVDDKGSLYEGLSSNFAVIMDEVLYTAPHGTVLAGVTMDMLLECCEKINLPIIYEFPKLGQMDRWQGAFITSTSRLLMPLDTIIVGETKKTVQFTKLEKFGKLAEMLNEEMQSRASKISPPDQ